MGVAVFVCVWVVGWGEMLGQSVGEDVGGDVEYLFSTQHHRFPVAYFPRKSKRWRVCREVTITVYQGV